MHKKLKDIENTFEYRINERMVNLVIALLGVVGLLVGIMIQHEPASTILLSIGASLLASAVVTYLSSIYIYKRKKEKELIDTWGLNAIYKTRQSMNQSCDMHFSELENNLDYIAFGLRSLRDSQGKRIEDKVMKGLKIRILTINPDSEFLKQREIDEDKQIGSIKDSILKLKAWMEKLQEKALNPDNVQLKYYNALPLDFYAREDDYVYVGPYQYGIDSQQTISFEFSSGAEGFKYYTEYFEQLWNKEEFAKRIV